MEKAVLLILSLTVLLTVSCADSTMTGSDLESVEIGENFTFIKSAERAEQVSEEQSEKVSDPFEINDVRIETSGDKKLMYIDVTQAKGCSEAIPEKFEVIWDGIMLMIYPAQIGFYLTYNSEVCTELHENVKETIIIDLHKHIGEYGESAQYTVINASKPEQYKQAHVNQ